MLTKTLWLLPECASKLGPIFDALYFLTPDYLVDVSLRYESSTGGPSSSVASTLSWNTLSVAEPISRVLLFV